MSFEGPLPALEAKKVHPRERMNERVWIQHALMGRDPEGPEAWHNRYAKTFGDLFDTNQEFYETVRAAHMENEGSGKEEKLRAIQDWLDAEASGASS